jgi:hypothetical protein
MHASKRHFAASATPQGIDLGKVCTFNAEFAQICRKQNSKPHPNLKLTTQDKRFRSAIAPHGREGTALAYPRV